MPRYPSSSCWNERAIRNSGSWPTYLPAAATCTTIFSLCWFSRLVSEYRTEENTAELNHLLSLRRRIFIDICFATWVNRPEDGVFWEKHLYHMSEKVKDEVRSVQENYDFAGKTGESAAPRRMTPPRFHTFHAPSKKSIG